MVICTSGEFYEFPDENLKNFRIRPTAREFIPTASLLGGQKCVDTGSAGKTGTARVVS